MQTQKLLLVLTILFVVFYGKAQIVIDCDNEEVGIGYGLTTPANDVHLKGEMRFESRTGVYYDFINITGYGWGIRPCQDGTGILGYQNQLHIVDATYIYGDNLQQSDLSLKKNIVPLYDALPLIKKLRPVTFDYNRDRSGTEDINLRNELTANDKNRLGFIAQEVQQILPQSVTTKTIDSTLSIRMLDFIPLLVKGMQEQQAQIDSLVRIINNNSKPDDLIKSAQINSDGKNSNNIAKLEQNNPNPFSEQTTINCFIPSGSNDARLLVFNMQGTLVKSYVMTGRNETSVTIAGAELIAGMYIYSLIIDNKEVDSKRMILSN